MTKDDFRILCRAEKMIQKEKKKQIMVEKAKNLRLMCDYVVSCSYGDIVLIIHVLHHYLKEMNEKKNGDVLWEYYYKDKFTKIADKLSKQIEYDYEKALEKCKKNSKKKGNDIGEEALSLSLKYGKPVKKMEGANHG